MKAFKNHHDMSRRAALGVELAALAPFLAFMFVITVDFSRVFKAKLIIINCARNGALYASNPSNPSAFTSTAQAALADAADLSPAPQVTTAPGTDTDGHPYVDVTVTYTFTTVTHFPNVPSSIPLSSTVRVRVNP
jgi:Flp pilus assembly protein TadG